jgi:hypothetical protein
MTMSNGKEDWHVTALLCDGAQVAEGKLYVLGGGWALCGPGTFVHSLAVKLQVPWSQANRRHKFQATLVDEDSKPVMLGEPASELRMETEFEVGRPAGLPSGTPLDLPFAVNFGPMDLPPGRGYAWSMTIDGQDVARVSFRTRPA